MSSNTGANARVSIPSSLRKTIQNIKEIGGNHSDEDVYAMLKECNMDPNETVQRLLFLDTFHEVKRKRDKRKENVNGRVFEDLRRKATNQVRGARSGRGSFSPQYLSHDAGGGMNAAVRKENGYEDRVNAHKSPAPPVLKEVDSKMPKLMEKKSPTELPNGVIARHAVQNSESVDTGFPKDDTNAGPFKTEITLSQSEVNTKHAPSASEPLLTPKQSCDLQLPTAVGAIKHEVKSLQIAVDMKDSVHSEKDLGNSHNLIVQTQEKNRHGSGKVDVSMISSARSENTELVNIIQPEINRDILVSEKLSAAPTPGKSSAVNSLVNSFGPTKAIEESTSKLEKLKFSEGQHVILPNHIQVPDAVKNVLSFGSLGSCFGVGVNDIVNSDSNGKSNQASEVLVEDGNLNQAPEELVEDETAKKPDSWDDDTPSSADEENHPDPPPAPVAETISLSESSAPALKDDQQKQETLPEVSPQHVVVQTPTYYSLGPMPPMLGSSPISLASHDHQHQAYLSNSMNGNPLAMSTSAPTPPPNQSTGAIPSSVVVSVQPVPLLRQPYPPNFIPYAHYLSPFFVPPTLQFVGPGGFPLPLPTGSMYMPAVAAAPGMKTSPPYKAGTNGTNQTPFPIPAGAYAVINSPQVGYAPSTSVTSGVSNANEDLLPSMLKDNNIYLGQQNSASMPINSFFNIPPQGQHIAVTPQSGHGAFTAMYHPLQTVAAPVAAHPFVQQAQSMAGPIDSVGPPQPPPNAFQQPPQHHQINWNNSF